jgi:hypothetical protein
LRTSWGANLYLNAERRTLPNVPKRFAVRFLDNQNAQAGTLTEKQGSRCRAGKSSSDYDNIVRRIFSRGCIMHGRSFDEHQIQFKHSVKAEEVGNALQFMWPDQKIKIRKFHSFFRNPKKYSLSWILELLRAYCITPLF